VHTHDDRALFATPEMAAKASQGVTTVVTGNCGISLAPLLLDQPPTPPLDLIGDIADYRYARFSDYLAAIDKSPAALNAACLVGHSTLRVGAMTALDRPAEKTELARMGERLQEALDAGAIGLSSGLAYAPASHAPAAEIEALVGLLRPAGALYTTHMRNEADAVVQSLEESFAAGRAAGVPVVISHHKTVGRENFGRTVETLPLIEAAIARQEVGLDAYPYIASSTVLASAAQAAQALKVLVTWSKSAPEQAGRELSAIAADWGVSEKEAVERLQPAGAVYWTMDEADVQRVLGFPHTMIGSDGLPHDTHPHPRLWGAFPRVLGYYCRELGLFSLEEAVRRMTGLSAYRFGLAGRGILAPGGYADVTVFDPETVADRATFEKPTIPAAGIEHVFVNGRPVWREGRPTGERPGRTLRRQQQQAEARRLPTA
jgi:N-acyl-D-amino-acid deacylase